jgi:hypothetical protein
MEPDWQLLDFMERCSPITFARIRCIDLKAEGTPYSTANPYFLGDTDFEPYVCVARISRQHPEMQVKYIFDTFSWASWTCKEPGLLGFINDGIVLLKALRNINVGYLNPDYEEARELLLRGGRLRSRKKAASWFAPNLKFYCSQQELCEENFRRAAGRNYERVAGGLDTWIAVMKGWIKDGV